ncbi:MAG: SGNH/GDSL hydrolase family protein [Planctomycetes bacterium]|nr:SGNH/GDSL hydrolase family protein [Planctomycetota bacterium]
MSMTYRIAVAVWIVSASACAAESTFTPLTHPTGECNSEDNTGEWFRPDLGTAADIIPLKTRVYATKESVTGGVAMKWIFEKGSKGLITFEKGKLDMNAAGFTFYAKASKPLKFRICPNAAAEPKKGVEIGTEWKKYDIPYSEIGFTNEWWQILFQVLDPVEEHTWLILDRVGTEAPAFIKDPKIDPKTGPDEKLSSQDMLYGAEFLAKTLERLKAKKPFKLIALGDSITAGAQTMRGTWGVKVEDGVPFRYFGTMARIWEEEFGYKGITPVACGHGGWTTKQLLGVVEKDVLSQCGPDDLVILQSGGNDIAAGATVEQWKADTKELIAKVRTKTDQILILDTTITLGGPVMKVTDALSKGLKDLSAEEKVAGADVTKLFMYRGPAYASALLANGYHPDFMGHITIGEMIAPILTGKHQTYPE